MENLFSVGDKVICIDSEESCPPLIEGKSYTILSIGVCRCGIIRLDVGNSNGEKWVCRGCGIDTTMNHYKQERFIKPETNHALEEEIFEAMKGVKIEN